ncbi:MAG: glycosyltransferase family 8 protein [Flavobacteriaceae bacterium]
MARAPQPSRNAVVMAFDARGFRVGYAAALRLAHLAAGCYDVVVATEGCADLRSLPVQPPSNMEIVVDDPASFQPEGAPISGVGPWTNWRLVAPVRLAGRYDRLLIVDFDVAARRSPAPLFDLDLEGNVLAAAWDAPMFEPASRLHGAMVERVLGLGVRRTDDYLNAGVMLVDCAAWSASDMPGRVSEAFARAGEKFAWPDQDCLSAVLDGAWTRLSPVWNFENVYMIAGIGSLIDPALLHYCGRKPWDGPRSADDAVAALDMAAIHAAAGWPDPLFRYRALPESRAERVKRMLGGGLRARRKAAGRDDKIRRTAHWLLDDTAERIERGDYADIRQGAARLDAAALRAAAACLA